MWRDLEAVWQVLRPINPAGIGRWVIASMLFYICLYYIVAWIRSGRPDRGFGPVSNATTFSGSILCILAVLDEEVYRAIGDVRIYLATAGIIGLIYCINMLFELDPPAGGPISHTNR